MATNYRQIKLIGEGSYGKCYLCENTEDGSRYVIKQIDISKMSEQEKKEAYHEAKIMSEFDHPNIVRFRDVYTTTNGNLNIVMDYADGGDLQGKIKSQKGRLFQEKEIIDTFVQIALALKHVHDRKVLHRDLKGQNIFLTSNGIVKLGDFGIARVLSNSVDKAKTAVGTPYYLSPEIIENRPYSFKSDVWALGVLLYELCTLRPPFDGSSLQNLALKIVRGLYPPISPQFSRDLKHLVAQLLSVDPNKRPTVAQILRQPFIKNRIQGLLSESISQIQYSQKILHKRNVPEGSIQSPRESPRFHYRKPKLPYRPKVEENVRKVKYKEINLSKINEKVNEKIDEDSEDSSPEIQSSKYEREEEKVLLKDPPSKPVYKSVKDRIIKAQKEQEQARKLANEKIREEKAKKRDEDRKNFQQELQERRMKYKREAMKANKEEDESFSPSREEPDKKLLLRQELNKRRAQKRNLDLNLDFIADLHVIKNLPTDREEKSIDEKKCIEENISNAQERPYKAQDLEDAPKEETHEENTIFIENSEDEQSKKPDLSISESKNESNDKHDDTDDEVVNDSEESKVNLLPESIAAKKLKEKRESASVDFIEITPDSIEEIPENHSIDDQSLQMNPENNGSDIVYSTPQHDKIIETEREKPGGSQISIFIPFKELSKPLDVFSKPQKRSQKATVSDKKKIRDEERKKFMLEIQKRNKQKKQDDFHVEWIGGIANFANEAGEIVFDNDHKRMYKELENAMNEDAETENEVICKETIQEETQQIEEVIVDREDELENQEIIHGQQEVGGEFDDISAFSAIELYRHYLEDKLGIDSLLEVYNKIKDLESKQDTQWDYDSLFNELQPTISQDMKESIQWVHSLIYLERTADLLS